jgi:hypothetical protein
MNMNVAGRYVAAVAVECHPSIPMGESELAICEILFHYAERGRSGLGLTSRRGPYNPLITNYLHISYVA